MGGTSQGVHVVGHPQFLIFHKVRAGEVELLEHLEIMHVSLVRNIAVEYLERINMITCIENTLQRTYCML